MITVITLNPAIDKTYFIEDFSVGGLYRKNDPVKSAGGKGINVARVVSLLGGNSGVVGFKAGNAGIWLESEIEKLGIQTNFLQISGESRTNINIIDNVNKTQTEILEIGPIAGFDDIERFLQKLEELLPYTKILVCTGTLIQGVPSGFYASIIGKAQQYGIKVVLDSYDIELVKGVKARPYLVKPNLKELCGFADKKLFNIPDILVECKKIISYGVEFVVASLGERGALLVSENVSILASMTELQAINPIGSGDAMVAGICVGIERGYEINDAFRLGVACGVSNTQFLQIGFVDTNFIEQILNDIILTDI